MTSLVAYRQVVDAVTTHSLRLPAANAGEQAAQELCMLPDGRTVVALFEGYTLPANQPTAISDSIETLVLDGALKAQIKAASPIVKLISTQMLQKIRDAYSAEDEAYFARIGVGAALGAYTFGVGEQEELLAFGAFVEGVRQWGRDERTKLGL
jgi:hypothetical protein